MKIVFTGGGTGGHIFPILAICREIKKIYPKPDLRLYYIGPKDKYTLNLLSKEGVKVKKILTGKLRRYFSFKNLLDFFKMPIGFIQSFFWLFFLAPDLIFSKGGYGSFPVTWVSNIFNIPIFLHESDVRPGLASRIESKWALEIFISFLKTEFFPKDKRVLVGNPIREEILGGSRDKAKETLKLRGDKPLILFIGGSQGSEKINEIILEILPDLLKNFEIIHQTGRKNFKKVLAESKAVLFDENLRKYYHPFPFLKEPDLKEAFGASDLVVSRAGSGSIFEIAACGKPAILIPLPYAAQNHQLKNAYEFCDKGGGEVIEEKNLKPHFFLEKLKYLFERTDILENMAEKSQGFAKTRAAKVIASYIVAYFAAVKSKKGNLAKS